MSRKPNLLFIFTDEQRADTMAAYGNRWVQTPNLNRLAEESVVFENAYVTQPVCTPSRSTIMTGLYPHTTGCLNNNVPLRPETPTIAEMVPGDYIRGYYGKWHLGDEIFAQHGFTDWVSIEDMYRPYYSKPEYLRELSSYHHFLVGLGYTPGVESLGAKVFRRSKAARLPEPHTKAGFLGEQAARFIRTHRADPFMLFVNFLEPHMPFTGPLDGMYDPAGLPVGPQFLQRPGPNTLRYHRLMSDWYAQREFGGPDLRTEAGWRTIRARYHGLVTLVDRAVGRILAALRDSGLDENTIVVFTSDHGDMMGDHRLLAKCVMYEEALKVPLLVRAPGSSPRRVGGRVSQVDLVPTLLELLDQPVPPGLEGRSRADAIRGAGRLDGDVIVEWQGVDAWPDRSYSPDISEAEYREVTGQPMRTIISPDGWKLTLSPVDRGELYDLNRDPVELNNLIDEPAQAGRIRDLAGRLRAWQKATNDTAPLPGV